MIVEDSHDMLQLFATLHNRLMDFILVSSNNQQEAFFSSMEATCNAKTWFRWTNTGALFMITVELTRTSIYICKIRALPPEACKNCQ